MKTFAFRSFLAGLAALLAAPAMASITLNSVAPNNANTGIMFSIETGSQSLMLESLSSRLAAEGSADYAVYILKGDFSSYITDASAWTLLGLFSDIGPTSDDEAQTFDFTDYLLDADSSYSLYFTSTGGGSIRYSSDKAVGTVGTVVASDANLSILTGVGKGELFGRTSILNRSFAGSLSYDVVGAEVPEPGSLALVGLAGLGLLASRRRNKSAA